MTPNPEVCGAGWSERARKCLKVSALKAAEAAGGKVRPRELVEAGWTSVTCQPPLRCTSKRASSG